MRRINYPVVVGLAAAVVLATASTGGHAAAKESATYTVKRCGYTKALYGRSAVYPWHMTCAQARQVIARSDAKHAVTVDFGAGWDGAAVAIDGKFWVCTGLMGSYNCGYPWRPIAVQGTVGYAGPFTRDVAYDTCLSAEAGACGPTSTFTQPR